MTVTCMKPSMAIRLTAATAILAVGAVSGGSSGAELSARARSLTIVPLTTVAADGSGYLADPQPIRRASSPVDGPQFLSGTTKAIIACPLPLSSHGCSWKPIRVDAAGLRPLIDAVGVTVTNIQNVDLFQADDGRWHAAVTIGVKSARHPRHWTVIAHAHPISPDEAGGPPLVWQADTLLSGDFTHPEEGNYDAKYYEEDGRLYLLYVRNTAPPPELRNVIVLQPMLSYTLAAGPAVTLLTPGDRYGELNSEWFANTQAKLVEAPWIAVIGGKHALVYSTGSYLTSGYKAGVAWSDTLVPMGKKHYRKVLEPDPQNVWGSAGGRDVHYLVQSARPRWPSYTGGEVVGPGVAALVQERPGAWWLFFNGFAPDDMPRLPNGRVNASHRRPFAMRLHAVVPADRSVVSVSDIELASWLTFTQ